MFSIYEKDANINLILSNRRLILICMKIKAAMHSSFPRIGEQPEEQKLRRAIAGFEAGKITKDELTAVENQVVDETIGIQVDAGLELVSDGLIRWYDLASHIAKNLSGFDINGLLRFFDTNTYYRQPVVQGDISSGDGNLSKEIFYTAQIAGKSVKSVLLGPLSLAAMSLNKSAMKLSELSLRLGELLGHEAAMLGQHGAEYVQIEEPWLVRNPEYFDLFRESFERFLKAKGNAKIILTFYFGDTGKIYDKLGDIPVDMIGIDFTYSPGLLNRIASEGSVKPISLGILDGRNTKLESASEVALSLEALIKRVTGECHLTTSCGLEYLPRAYAIRKLKLTAEVAELLNG
jgi:5-methyltetrahydropteroyltriglutamate--homocysteine methyltransferase